MQLIGHRFYFFYYFFFGLYISHIQPQTVRKTFMVKFFLVVLQQNFNFDPQ